ncbi:MAG: Rab family GTPase [Candidatus Thorarchaeota archaeon]
MPFRNVGSKAYKAVLIGDGTVGKTSIRRSYLGENFKSNHLPTIGVDFAQKWISFNGHSVRFVIWDLAGQPSFERVRQHYYVGSHGIFLVYSVVDRESFDNAAKWLVEAYKYMGTLPPTVVVGNKIDLRNGSPNGTYLTKEDGFEFVDIFNRKLDVPAVYVETSALTGENINIAFQEILRMMSNYDYRDEEEPS